MKKLLVLSISLVFPLVIWATDFNDFNLVTDNFNYENTMNYNSEPCSDFEIDLLTISPSIYEPSTETRKVGINQPILFQGGTSQDSDEWDFEYTWIFDDDPDPAWGSSVEHTFTAKGYHYINLIMEDTNSGCSKLLIFQVEVVPTVYVDEQVFDPEDLVNEFLIGNTYGIISNFSATTGTDFEDVNGLARFDNMGSDFPVSTGIILSSGDAYMAGGPKTTDQSNGTYSWPGDADIEELIEEIEGAYIDSYNATILEFDFIPYVTEMNFNYIFASDEYGIWQCEWTDTFAFFLTDSEGNTTNIAVLPNEEATPVTVRTIRNSGSNNNCDSQNEEYFDKYYSNVTYGYHDPDFLNPQNEALINFRGNTVLLNAFAPVNPGEQYHIKLVIADRGDYLYDSAVFLENGSFNIGAIALGQDITPENGNSVCLGEVITVNSGVEMVDGIGIKWFKDGVEISGETTPSIEVTESATYSVCVSVDILGFGCAAQDSIEVTFLPTPDLSQIKPSNLLVCSPAAAAEFDLTQNDIFILGNQNPSDFVISYYTTASYAEEDLNPIPNPESLTTFLGIGESATIYARIEGFAAGQKTGCFETTDFIISSVQAPLAHQPEDLYLDAESSNLVIDLTQSSEEILGSQNPDLFNVLFFTSEENAVNGANAIQSPQSYTIESENEVIWVRIENRDGMECFAITNFNIYTENLSVDNIDFENSLRIWPNPTSELLHIEWNHPIENIVLMDLRGRQILNTHQTQIKLTSLSPGIYFIRIESGTQHLLKRIIKR